MALLHRSVRSQRGKRPAPRGSRRGCSASPLQRLSPIAVSFILHSGCAKISRCLLQHGGPEPVHLRRLCCYSCSRTVARLCILRTLAFASSPLVSSNS